MNPVRGLRLAALFLLILCLPALHAQFSGAASTSVPGLNVRPTLTTDPAILYPPDREIRLMAGDLLRVSLYGITPLYQEVERVSLDGTVRLSLAGVIELQGLSLKDAEAAVADRFEKEQTFHNAQVSMEITEAPGHVATVIGAVKGSVPIAGRMRLFDVLSHAGLGAIPASASNVISIQRPGIAQPIVVDIGNDPAHSEAGNVPIFAGDTIVISEVGLYYVVGAVIKPGAAPLIGAVPTTVVQAVTAAGGTNFAAKLDDTKLVRTTGTQRIVLNAPLKKIMEGKAPDIPLQTDDIVLVPTSAVRNALRNGGITSAIAIALAAATFIGR